ncbi:tetratricopeptide (TPR) repeat protein [Xanthomonas translucens]
MSKPPDQVRDERRRPQRSVPLWRDRRVWRWALAALLLAALALVMLRRPLADLLWPETRIQQLLDQGNAALRAGRLSAADGSGARERFEAALALDGDRQQARAGLAATGRAALGQARAALAAGRYGQVRSALALARALQVPRADADRIDAALRQREAAHAGLDQLLQKAAQAQREGRLDGTPDAALPLYRQVLEFAPERTEALEGREDALSELLQRAQAALARGDVAAAAALVDSARGYDPGHVDLPAAQAALNRTLEALQREADAALRRQRLDAAARALAKLRAAAPDAPAARDSAERLAAAYAAQASRAAADFRFAEAERALQKGQAVAPDNRALADARQALTRARQSQATLQSTLSPAARARRLQTVLAELQAAEARGDWLTPPGSSAYDALQAAQVLAPRDARVRSAEQRVLAALRRCFDDELRGNRVLAASACYDAWRALAPGGNGVAAARRRLAQRWLAVGDERLSAGDADFAREALRRARAIDPGTPELAAFARRLRSLSPGG